MHGVIICILFLVLRLIILIEETGHGGSLVLLVKFGSQLRIKDVK